MKRKLIILLVLMSAALIGLNAQKSVEAKVTAENQYMDDTKLVASVNVEIAWEDYRIYADYLEFDQKTKELLARGRVTMVSKDTIITGEKLRFNLKERTGEMYETYGQMPPTIRYTTDKLNQVDDKTLTFNKLDLTSCTQCLPRWKISCTKGKIKKERYIEMKNVVFKLKKIPFFYVPYLRYPIQKDGRATGLLIPKIGTSDLRGFFLLNSFFWDIKPNVDLTLSVDWYAKNGLGLAEEFRYLFRHMEGKVRFYYFKYKEDNLLGTESESDYLLNAQHKQKINFLNTSITVSIDKQSNANFLRLFSNDFDNALTRTTRQAVSIQSSYGNLKFTAGASQNDTYFTFNNTSRILKYLPNITLNLTQQKLWKIPGYLTIKTNYSTVTRLGKSYEEEEEGYFTDLSSTRFTINPSYSVSLLRLPWMSSNLSFQSKHTFYMQSKTPESPKGNPVILDESLHLQYQTANLTFKGPIFFKIYEFKDTKFKHLFEPKLTFRYVTKVEDEDRNRLIPVDFFDYPSYSYVGLSLTTRLLYRNKKNTESAREVMSYTVKQNYYFDALLANRDRKINGEYPEFSELSNILRIKPAKGFSLDSSLVYNYYLKKFIKVRVSLGYKDRKGRFTGNFFFNTNINPYAKADNPLNREFIGGKLKIDFPRFPIKFDANVNYDITKGQFRLGSFKLGYDYQCITFGAELRLFRYVDRVETQFNFGVTFGNIGQVRDLLGLSDKKK